MKHLNKVTVAKADDWNDIEDWFEGVWDQISDFFKGND